MLYKSKTADHFEHYSADRLSIYKFGKVSRTRIIIRQMASGDVKRLSARLELSLPGMSPEARSAITKHKKMIQQMYETNLDHQDWDKAKSTCLICKIDDNITVNLEDKTIGEEGTHAEEFLLQELEKKSEVRNVTVFMNNSPCSTPNHTCADKLLKYLDANENVRMTMYVTRLYMIARESCKRDGHSEDITNGSVHSAGLQRLKQHARCEINAFNKNVWEELLNITKMTKEFKEEFMSKYCNVRSRKEEDDCIRSDLEII